MYLLIDQGNSRCKYLLTQKVSPLLAGEKGAWDNHDFDQVFWSEQLERFAEKPLKKIVVSSVAGQERKGWFKRLCLDVLGLEPIFATTSDEQALDNGCTLYNSYEQPSALGVDRWLAMLEALELNEGACMVVDAGTAITLDVIDSRGKHRGGHIVPGLNLIQQSLLGETQNIAWSAGHDSKLDGSLLGTNTSAAIAFGAEVMVLGYTKEIIAQLAAQELMPGRIIITGGDASLIEKGIKELKGIFSDKLETEYRPDLVLEGLARWFSLNN
ncbi:type III pantothenate kinase [Kangiella sediminilitoris]|uniref:Type III pantothenate kinase n=1 Tax=Kangiella sediminilitoris TaxID=1144748 RepID=A0A1B3BD34_9GAMM|nr:type III pantothenate kinase [Kangiella sediminilitoris]AOE50711.1 Type III pantothenate kinase [Kangiella sediminilitoris]